MMYSMPHLSRHLFLTWLFIAALFCMMCSGISSLTAQAAGGQAQFNIIALGDSTHPQASGSISLNNVSGSKLQENFRITNTGTASGTVTIYPVDALTGSSSGIVYPAQGAPRSDIGAWFTPGVHQIALTPGQSQVAMFELTVPTNAHPGPHMGGIIAESVAQPTTSVNIGQGNNFQMHVTTRMVVPVIVTQPGAEIDQLVAQSIQAGGVQNAQSVLLNLKNTGTTIIKPSGTLEISDAQGHILQNLPITMSSFLPQTTIDYPVYVQKKALDPGNYTATLTLAYGHNHTLHTAQPFSVTVQQLKRIFINQPGLQGPTVSTSSPWVLVGVGLVILLAIGGGFTWIYRMGRKRAMGQSSSDSNIKQ
jgi:hypothetical protein